MKRLIVISREIKQAFINNDTTTEKIIKYKDVILHGSHLRT